jgi:serine/threonine protein kinase
MDKDAFFSRYHFRVEAKPPECWLVDLESGNGTHVNGQRVQNADLREGDCIECGNTVFQVTVQTGIRAEDEPTRDFKPDAIASVTIDFVPPTKYPQRVGDFELDQEIGRGAMGIVFHAMHYETKHEAAVKLIRPTGSARLDSMKLFLRETAIAGQLRHPRIVDYIGHGFEDGWMFLATEYLPVLNIRKVISSQSRSKQIRLACGILCRALEALQFAHSQDIVHRDVKPSKILAFKKDGRLRIKLADFGLAKNYLHA